MSKSHYQTITIREDFYILAQAIAEEEELPVNNAIEKAIEHYFDTQMPYLDGKEND